MIPLFPNFILLSEAPVEEIQSFVGAFEPYSDFNFLSLFGWDTDENTRVSMLNGNLVISRKEYTGENSFLSFIGTNNLSKTIHILMNYAKNATDMLHELQLIPESSLPTEPLEGLVAVEDRDNFDYILSSEESHSKEGQRYANQRKNLNKFERNYGEGIKTELVDLKNQEIQKEIMELVDAWKGFGTDGSSTAQDEKTAISRLFSYIDMLNKHCEIRCLGVFYNDKLVAFCIFELLPNGWGVTHYGKASQELRSLYEYLMSETLGYLLMRGRKWINYEQDLGIPGLRASKESQHPHHFLKKYIIRLDQNDA